MLRLPGSRRGGGGGRWQRGALVGVIIFLCFLGSLLVISDAGRVSMDDGPSAPSVVRAAQERPPPVKPVTLDEDLAAHHEALDSAIVRLLQVQAGVSGTRRDANPASLDHQDNIEDNIPHDEFYRGFASYLRRKYTAYLKDSESSAPFVPFRASDDVGRGAELVGLADLIKAGVLNDSVAGVALRRQKALIPGPSCSTWKPELSFGNALRRLFMEDMPLYVNPDPFLHAFHMTFDDLLKQIEKKILFVKLHSVVQSLWESVERMEKEDSGDSNSQELRDLDVYLSVAKAVLHRKKVVLEEKQDDGSWVKEGDEVLEGGSKYGYYARYYVEDDRYRLVSVGEKEGSTVVFPESLERVSEIVGMIEAAEGCAPGLTDEDRVDYSQYKPRGHYEDDVLLQKYFKAMMWFGREGFKSTKKRQVSAALTLGRILEKKENEEARSDLLLLLNVIEGLIGKPDALSIFDLMEIAKDYPVASKTADAIVEMMTSTEEYLEAYGSQNVQKSEDETVLLSSPKSIHLFTQRFILDGWAMARSIHPMKRREPSALDIAYSVLGNDDAAGFLASRLKNPERRFRDGMDVSDRLSALRRVVDGLPEWYWGDSVYTAWLRTLRALSPAHDDAPGDTRTPEWKALTINSQLASYADLKHDTILYTKQPGGFGITCEFPRFYVDPRVEFWDSLAEMVAGFRDAISPLLNVAADSWRDRVSSHLKVFETTIRRLSRLSANQKSNVALSEEDQKWLQEFIEIIPAGDYCGAKPTYSGWFYKLFWGGHTAAEKDIRLIADVFTNPPDDDSGDPGSIVHEAVGKVRYVIVEVDGAAYVAPVKMHHEIYPGQRLADSEWKLRESGQEEEVQDYQRSLVFNEC